MTREELIAEIYRKQSFLCVGLDPELEKIPQHLLDFEDPIFEFNKRIIDATAEFAVAFKPNTAFYEAQGVKGWASLEKTLNYLPKNCFVIADAKRGDIGNTAAAYAKTFFETLPCDAVTVAPYMGKDSVQPFLQLEGKWAIVLGLTSNEGAQDFQTLKNSSQQPLYAHVIEKVASWGTPENLMFVVGATRAERLKEIRSLVPKHFLLVPGVGAQGGSLEQVVDAGMNPDVGLLINASRSIIYASSGKDFDLAAKKEALKLQTEMGLYLQRLMR
ncbi:MAG: orotidine-5'-phosphate decarboxylase [Flavobacteriia bacterium]|nr:orotidine-5'-phosphate decarboxylase [Flavobacteriia bacterium]